MAAPQWTRAPRATLMGSELVLVDRGDWSIPESQGAGIDRYAVVWHASTGETVGSIPPSREHPEEAAKRTNSYPPGKEPATLELTDARKGRSWRPVVYGGFLGGGAVGESWLEWGRFQLGTDATPAAGPFVAVPTAAPAPVPLPTPTNPPTLESASGKAVAALITLEDEWRRQGKSEAWIFDTLVHQCAKALLLPSGTGLRAKVKDAIKQALA
jgi:hypothetical protein